MNRREFIKAAGATAVTAVVPVAELAAAPLVAFSPGGPLIININEMGGEAFSAAYLIAMVGNPEWWQV